MSNKVSDLVMDWRTFLGVAGILLGGVVWTNTQLWTVESHITGNKLEFTKQIASLKIDITKEFGLLRAEIGQYHTMVGSLQTQQNKLEKLVITHQLSRQLHK